MMSASDFMVVGLLVEERPASLSSISCLSTIVPRVECSASMLGGGPRSAEDTVDTMLSIRLGRGGPTLQFE